MRARGTALVLCLILRSPSAARACNNPFFGNVVGAVWDAEGSHLLLLGDGDGHFIPPFPQDIAVALRWAIGRSETPGRLSIDPNNPDRPGPWMRVAMNDEIAHTTFGWTMFEAGRIMMSLNQGYDNISHKPLRMNGLGFRNVLEVAQTATERQEGAWHRFWLMPGQHHEEVDDRAMRIVEAKMTVKAEVIHLQGGKRVSTGSLRAASGGFAQFMAEHYQDIARSEPPFNLLDRLFRLLLVAEWLRQHAFPLHWGWIDSESTPTFTMPAWTPSLTSEMVKDSSDSPEGGVPHTPRVSGGVSFENLALAPTSKNLDGLAKAAISAALDRREFLHTFTFEGRRWTALSLAKPEVETQVLAELPLPGGRTLPMIARSPVGAETEYHLPRDRVLASPRLIGISTLPARRIPASGGTMDEWRRGQEYRTVPGRPASSVPVRRYQLTDASMRMVATFERHTVDTHRQQIVVEPFEGGKGGKTWTLIPIGESLVEVFEKPDHIYTFEPNSGLLLVEQLGDTLVRYHYDRQQNLQKITTGGGDGNAKLVAQADYGSNMHRLLSLRTPDGSTEVQLAEEPSSYARRTLEVRWVFDRALDPETVTLDFASGDLIGSPSPSLVQLMGARGHRLAQVLSGAEMAAGDLNAGAFTFLVAKDRKRVFILPSPSFDWARIGTLTDIALP